MPAEKCPLLRTMRMAILYFRTEVHGEVEDSETDCIGDRCGSFNLCSGTISVIDGPEQVADLVYPERIACVQCGKKVRLFQNGRISRHKDQGGAICGGYRSQRDMGEGTGA